MRGEGVRGGEASLTFVHIRPLPMKSLRHLLVWVRLDAEGLADREDLEEEWEVALGRTVALEAFANTRTDQLRVRCQMLRELLLRRRIRKP